MEKSSALSEFLTNHFRNYAIEVFQCRHCKSEAHASETNLCDAQLCQKCFDAREKYRKDYPQHGGNYPEDYDKKAENNMSGDQYGNSRDYISVICASCNNIYELVPDNFEDISLEIQQMRYDATFSFHNGKTPFSPLVLKYKYAPKGWENNVLCKQCYDNFLAKHEDEIHTITEDEKIQNIETKKTIQKEKEQKRIDDYQEERLWNKIWVISAIVIILIVGLKMCDSGVFYSQDMDELPYYRH